MSFYAHEEKRKRLMSIMDEVNDRHQARDARDCGVRGAADLANAVEVAITELYDVLG